MPSGRHEGDGTAGASERLLPRLRRALRTRHYSRSTEEAYTEWVRRYVHFHGLRHPITLGPTDVGAFLSDLAARRPVSASTQAQALAALLFLYRARVPPSRRHRRRGAREAAAASPDGAHAPTYIAGHAEPSFATCRAVRCGGLVLG
jgi:hypothetical protein